MRPFVGVGLSSPGRASPRLFGVTASAKEQSKGALDEPHRAARTPKVSIKRFEPPVPQANCTPGAAEARKHGFERVADFGSPFHEPRAVAG